MSDQTVRSAAKNVSKSGRSKLAKNSRRIEAAVNDELEGCTYGRITKTLGNKMFKIIDVNMREHLGYIRGRMARMTVNDIVLLNIRDYETRSGSTEAVYDIMAVFNEKKDINKLIKTGIIPECLVSGSSDEGLNALFDYNEDEDEDEDENEDDNTAKKDKVSHRKAGKNTADISDYEHGEINIDKI